MTWKYSVKHENFNTLVIYSEQILPAFYRQRSLGTQVKNIIFTGSLRAQFPKDSIVVVEA